MSEPVSHDDPDWERIAGQRLWDKVTDEQVVTAFQTMRLTADPELVDRLSNRITTRLLEVVRGAIGRGHPDNGWGAVEDAMDRLRLAVFQEQGYEADGAALGSAFALTARRRATDAVRRLTKQHRRRASALDGHDRRALPASAVQRPSQEGDADLAKVLRLLPDHRERLAFLLHLDGAPMTGKGSICQALDVSRPTAKKLLDKAKRRVGAGLGFEPQGRKGR